MASQYRRRSLMLNTIAKVAQGNPTIITDSSSRRLQKLNVYGQSEQRSTTGAQLLNYYKEGIDNGVTWKIEGSFVSFNGTIKDDSPNGILITNIPFKQETNKTYYVKSFNSALSGDITVKKNDDSVIYVQQYTIDGTEKEIYARCMVNDTNNQAGLKVDITGYIALTENSAMSEWEPYTGGKPSPSPDYPQEIISKEVSEIKVTNGADLSQTATLTEPITLRGIPVDNGGNVTIDGQQYIADVICEKDGVIGVERYTQELLVSSMNKLYLTLGTHTNGQPYLSCDIEDKDTYLRTIKPLCNRYIGSYYTMDNGKVYVPNTKGFIINDNRFTDKDTAISIITDEETKVLLPLLNSTFEPLPEEIQAQYKALKSYYPNTVIQTGCWNEVTYSAKRGG